MRPKFEYPAGRSPIERATHGQMTTLLATILTQTTTTARLINEMRDTTRQNNQQRLEEKRALAQYQKPFGSR